MILQTWHTYFWEYLLFFTHPLKLHQEPFSDLSRDVHSDSSLAGLWVILLKDPSLPQPAVQKALELVLRLSLCLAAFSISSNLTPLSVPAATTTVLHWRTGTHLLPHFQVQVASGTQNANGPMLLQLRYYSSPRFNLWLASKSYILLIYDHVGSH